MVAEGSQASYPASGSVRIPDWTSCIFGTTKGDVIALAASVKETVNVEKEVVPVEVLGTDVHRPPMRFAERGVSTATTPACTLRSGYASGAVEATGQAPKHRASSPTGKTRSA